MVLLSIQALRGNHGARYYPYSGYLGLTKVLIEGVVKTRLEDDRKSLPASSITISVKCYEARTKLTLSRVNCLIDVSQTLWNSSLSNEKYEEIGDIDLPFRVVLPTKIGGYSTFTFPEYRVFWRLEAAINHPPQFGLGVRQIRTYDLSLTRYDLPLPPPPPRSLLSSYHPGFRISPATLRFPQFHYRIDKPVQSVGPDDNLPIIVCLLLDPSYRFLHLHSASVTLERRMELFEATGSASATALLSQSSGTVTPDNSSVPSLSLPDNSSNIGHTSTTSFTRKRSTSPLQPVVLPAKTVTGSIANAETSEFRPGDNHELNAFLNIKLPPKPPPSQWPIGETLKTDLATIRFYLRIKIHASTEGGNSEVELEPYDLALAPISEEHRSRAIAKIAEKKASKSVPNSRKNSPSPSVSGSSKAPDPETPPPLPHLRMSHSSSKLNDDLSQTQEYAAVRSAAKKRPSTLALSLASTSAVSPGNESFSPTNRRIQKSAVSSSSKRPGTPGKKTSPERPKVQQYHRSSSIIGHTATMSQTVASTVATSVIMPTQAVQDWEQELERVARKSKRRSESMWGLSSSTEALSRAERKTSKQRRELQTNSVVVTVASVTTSIVPSSFKPLGPLSNTHEHLRHPPSDPSTTQSRLNRPLPVIPSA